MASKASKWDVIYFSACNRSATSQGSEHASDPISDNRFIQSEYRLSTTIPSYLLNELETPIYSHSPFKTL